MFSSPPLWVSAARGGLSGMGYMNVLVLIITMADQFIGAFKDLRMLSHTFTFIVVIGP